MSKIKNNHVFKVLKRIFFSKFSFRKSQLTLFFIAIIATLLIITMVTINIGKIAKDKTYTENGADSGALAAASVMAYAFNYVAEANKGDEDYRLEKNYKDFRTATNGGGGGDATGHMPYFRNANKQQSDQLLDANTTKTSTGCLAQGCTVCEASTWTEQTKSEIGAFYEQMDELKKAVRDFYEHQRDFYRVMRETVHDDGSNGGGNDLYSAALKAGYQYNLYNSGMPVKMGEDAKEFYEWVDKLKPNNCTPETYNWSDGAGRNHMVTATVCIGSVHSYQVDLTQNSHSTTQSLLDTAKGQARTANGTVESAEGVYKTACALCNCTTDALCVIADNRADDLMDRSVEEMQEANQTSDQADQGLRKGKIQSSGSKNIGDEIIGDIDDITHSRSVRSNQFQFHMGGVVKGGRGDLDTPTFYPPTQSSATASFRGSGSIRNKSPRHDASLGM